MREMASRDVYLPQNAGHGATNGGGFEILHPRDDGHDDTGGRRGRGFGATSLQFRSRAQEWMSEGLVFSRTVLGGVDEAEMKEGTEEGASGRADASREDQGKGKGKDVQEEQSSS
jgi:hypothetical protein